MPCEVCHRHHGGPCTAEMSDMCDQQDRLNDILRRHARSADVNLSDRDFVLKVYERWRKDADAHHGDPNE